MKNLRSLVRGGVSKSRIALLLAFTLILSSGLSVFAIETGDTITFKHSMGSDGSYDRFTATGGWEGTCAEIGKSSPSSGTAKVTVLKNTDMITKIAYNYGYLKGWNNNMNGYKGWASSYGEVYSHLIRCANQGFSAWESGFRSVAGGNSPDTMINEVKALWNDRASLKAAKDGFECILCDQGDHQEFVMFRMAPSGKLKLKKVSSNTSITG